MGIWYADHLNHLVDDDDEYHRILTTRCRIRFLFVSVNDRQRNPLGNDHVSCLACLTMEDE